MTKQLSDWFANENNDHAYANDVTRLLPAPRMDYQTKSGFVTSGDQCLIEPVDQTMSFSLVTQAIGHQSISKTIYPKQSFDYEIYQEGKLSIEQQNSPYAMELIAYPKENIVVNFEIESKKVAEDEYELTCNIGGKAETKTLEYAVKATGQITSVKTDINLQALAAGVKIGAASESGFVMNNQMLSHGHLINQNKNLLTGMIDASKKIQNGEITFEYRPLRFDYTRGGTTHKDCKDDDLIGIVFRAKDANNFYVLFIEGQQAVLQYNNDPGSDYSSRFSSNFLTSPIIIQETNAQIWTNNNEWVINSKPFAQSQNEYQDTTGWGNKHHRLFQVTNGQIKQKQTTFNSSAGWLYDQTNRIRLVFREKIVSIFVNNETIPTLTFETSDAEGGYGVCNFSQPVSFTSIVAKEYTLISKQEPESGYYAYKGIGESIQNEKYATGAAWAKALLDPLAKGKPYTLLSVTAIRKYSTFGSATIGPNTPLTLHADNYASKTTANEVFLKKLRLYIEPQHDSEQTAKVLLSDVALVFNEEIDRFKKQNALLTIGSPIITLSKKPAHVDLKLIKNELIGFQLSSNGKKQSFQKNISVSRYQSWVKIHDFALDDLPVYSKISYQVSGISEESKKEISFLWGKTGSAENETRDEQDVLLVKCNAYFIPTWKQKANRGTLKGNQKQIFSLNQVIEWKYAGTKTIALPKPNWEYAMYFYESTPQMKAYFLSMPNALLIPGQDGPFYDAIKQKNMMITNQLGDQVAVYTEGILDLFLQQSGRIKGSASINGVTPFSSVHRGKSNPYVVSIKNIQMPKETKEIKTMVQCSNPLVRFEIKNEEIVFDCSYEQNIEIQKPFASAWSESSPAYAITGDEVIDCQSVLLPVLSSNITWDQLIVKSNHPFIIPAVSYQSGETNGVSLLKHRIEKPAKYVYETFLISKNAKAYERTIQRSMIENEITEHSFTRYASDFHEAFVLQANEFLLIHTVFVEANAPLLKIAIRSLTIQDPLKDYIDLNVIAPNGESFGFRFQNNTYDENGLIISQGKTSCTTYAFGGPDLWFEEMQFVNPIAGDWKVYADNPTNDTQGIQCFVSIGEVDSVLPLPEKIITQSIDLKVNGVSTNQFVLGIHQIEITKPLIASDVISFSYQTKEYDDKPFSIDLPLFSLIDSISMDGEAIPNDASNGYQLINQTLTLHGSYQNKEGYLFISYFVGLINRTFAIEHHQFEKRNAELLYKNNELLNATDYQIAGKQLTISSDVMLKHDDQLTLILVLSEHDFWEMELGGTKESIASHPTFCLQGAWNQFEGPIIQSQSASQIVQAILHVDHVNETFEAIQVPISVELVQPESETERLVWVQATEGMIKEWIPDFETLRVALGETGWTFTLETDLESWSFSKTSIVTETTNVNDYLFVELFSIMKNNDATDFDKTSYEASDVITEIGLTYESSVQVADARMQQFDWYELDAVIQFGSLKEVDLQLISNVPAVVRFGNRNQQKELLWSHDTAFGKAKWTTTYKTNDSIQRFTIRFLPKETTINLRLQIKKDNVWIDLPSEMILSELRPLIQAKIDDRFKQVWKPKMGFEIGMSHQTKWMHLPNAWKSNLISLVNQQCSIAKETNTHLPVLVYTDQHQLLRLSMHYENGMIALGEKHTGIIYGTNDFVLPHRIDEIDISTLVIKINGTALLSSAYALSTQQNQTLVLFDQWPNVQDTFEISYRLVHSYAYEWTEHVCHISVHSPRTSIYAVMSESNEPSVLDVPFFPWVLEEETKCILSYHINEQASYADHFWIDAKRVAIQIMNRFGQPIGNYHGSFVSNQVTQAIETDAYGYAIVSMNDRTGWLMKNNEAISPVYQNEILYWEIAIRYAKDAIELMITGCHPLASKIVKVFVYEGSTLVYGTLFQDKPEMIPLGKKDRLIVCEHDTNASIQQYAVASGKGR